MYMYYNMYIIIIVGTLHSNSNKILVALNIHVHVVCKKTCIYNMCTTCLLHIQCNIVLSVCSL